MEPKLIIVRFDETHEWREEHRENCTAIWGYYLVDLTQHIYQCSMSPDVQGYFLYNRLDWKGKKCPFTEDEMSENEWNDGGNSYPTFQAQTNWRQCKVIDCSDYDPTYEWKEYIDDQLEYYRGNPFDFEFCDNLITL
jgi:hypothetical protein